MIPIFTFPALSKIKRQCVILFVVLNIPFLLFAQQTPYSEEEDVIPIELQSQPKVPDFIKNLEAPKIVKNNVRARNIIITKTAIDSNNQLVVEGTVEIRNYADTPTSRLFMTSYLGIKGTGYYLQYPFYGDERSESFVLEPQQSITRPFRVVEDNFLAFGAAGVEVAVFDEYNKYVHSDAFRIPESSFSLPVQSGVLFTDLNVSLALGDKRFSLPQGPTFYPNEEDMFINIDFQNIQPTFLDGVQLKIYDRDFFTQPVRIFDTVLTKNHKQKTTWAIPLPKDLPPGVYPLQVIFNTDGNRYIPRFYGRFIVGGNMIKTTDIVLNSENHFIKNATIVVQGNPPDITRPEREKGTPFDIEIVVFGKNEKILSTKKITGEQVQIYKNIDVDFYNVISFSKITKIQVHLSDEAGIFDTYEKHFDAQE